MNRKEKLRKTTVGEPFAGNTCKTETTVLGRYSSKVGITLVALVITVIILLILAGITIQLTIGQQGILKRAEEAGKNYTQSAEQEKKDLDKLYSSIKVADGSQITLTTEELNEYINEKVQEYISSSSKSQRNILFEGNVSSGDITFLNNHTIDEFDTIHFVYGSKSGDSWVGLVETSFSTFLWKCSMNGETMKQIALNGFGNQYIGISNLSERGFRIDSNQVYSLCMVYGTK